MAFLHSLFGKIGLALAGALITVVGVVTPTHPAAFSVIATTTPAIATTTQTHTISTTTQAELPKSSSASLGAQSKGVTVNTPVVIPTPKINICGGKQYPDCSGGIFSCLANGQPSCGSVNLTNLQPPIQSSVPSTQQTPQSTDQTSDVCDSQQIAQLQQQIDQLRQQAAGKEAGDLSSGTAAIGQANAQRDAQAEISQEAPLQTQIQQIQASCASADGMKVSAAQNASQASNGPILIGHYYGAPYEGESLNGDPIYGIDETSAVKTQFGCLAVSEPNIDQWEVTGAALPSACD